MAKIFTRNGLEVAMVVTFVAMGVVGGVILKFVLPQYYFVCFPVVVVLFLIMGLVFHSCIKRWENRLDKGLISPTKAFNNFMIAKMIKLFVSVAIMLIYVKVGGAQPRTFLICYMLFYFAFLIIETLSQQSFEGRYKNSLEEKK